MSKFRVGDRVIRRGLTKEEPIRHGVITQVNNSWKDYKNQTTILYAVIWDDTKIEESGYMEIANGLDFETT